MSEADPELPLLKRQSLGDQVAGALRNLISTDRLKPGDRILETEYAERFGVSRGPVRDALKQLAVEGLVDLSEKGGAYVAEPSRHEARALVGLRYRMEEYAIELAMPRITPEGIAELRGLIEDMRQAAATSDVDRLQALDVRYHKTLWDWSGSKRLVELLSLAVSPLLLSKLWQRWHGDVFAAHEELLDTVAARDVAALRRNIEKHIRISLESLDDADRREGRAD